MCCEICFTAGLATLVVLMAVVLMVVIDATLPSRGVRVTERSGSATFCDNIRNVEENKILSLYSLKNRLTPLSII